MAKSHLPIQSLTHQKEDESRTRFDDAIFPWIVRHWHKSDYGIDAGVEITQPISSSEDRMVTGKRFDVQIKSSESLKPGSKSKSISVPISKINYWYSSNLPTMLCFFDENDGLFYYEWIDEELINFLNNNNPKWMGQKTVTIKLADSLSEKLDLINEYVYRWKRPSKVILTAGSYFYFNSQILSLIESTIAWSNGQGDNYLPLVLKELKSNLSKAIYSIAVAGQSRAGKSTLINALIEKEISPVGILPTTGVPICILPGMKEECEILFQDGRVEKGEVNIDFIEQFANQEKNRRNKKRVKLISAKIINQNFERGIALYDIPGLNDPNDDIRTLSDSVLLNSNAIIYVISASPMASGEFIMSKEILNDLFRLRNSSEKIFIVLSKVDTLDETQLDRLKEYLADEFTEYKVNKFHPSPPLYISAFEDKPKLSNISTVKDLNEKLWNFLLSQKKTGLHRLFSALNQANEAVIGAITICETRFLDVEQAKKVRKEITEVNSQLSEMTEKIDTYKDLVFKKIENRVNEGINVCSIHLANEMKKIPLNQPIFKSQQINAYLIEQSEVLSLEIQQFFTDSMVKLENEINSWIIEKLRQFQLEIKSNEVFKNPESNQYAWLIHRQLGRNQDNNLLQVLLALLASLIGGAEEVVETVLKGQKEVRSKKIASKHKEARKTLTKVFTSIISQMNNQFDVVAKEIMEKTKERTRIYLNSLEEQLSNKETPISEQELIKLTQYVEQLKEIQSRINSLAIQIEEQVEGMQAN